MKNKVYTLQKDLPDSKAGDEYILVPFHHMEYGAYYLNGDTDKSCWTKECVENNPEWFLPKEESKYCSIEHIMIESTIQVLKNILKIRRKRAERNGTLSLKNEK